MRPVSHRVRSCASRRTGSPRSSTRLGAPGGVEAHQGEERTCLGLAGEELGEELGQPEGLVRQIGPDQLHADGRGVTLVEDQVEHLEHRGEPRAEVRATRHLERHSRLAERALRPDHPLGDGGLGGEERASDLLGGEPAHHAEGQRHPGFLRENRMTGGEEQAQHVVAHVPVHAVGQRRLDLARRRLSPVLQLLRRAGALGHRAPADCVQCPVPRRGRQPGAGPVGIPVRGHSSSAASTASWAKSSASDTSRSRRASPPMTRGASSFQIAANGALCVGSGHRDGPERRSHPDRSQWSRCSRRVPLAGTGIRATGPEALRPGRTSGGSPRCRHRRAA